MLLEGELVRGKMGRGGEAQLRYWYCQEQVVEGKVASFDGVCVSLFLTKGLCGRLSQAPQHPLVQWEKNQLEAVVTSG